jgi:hypothetical protein
VAPLPPSDILLFVARCTGLFKTLESRYRCESVASSLHVSKIPLIQIEVK